MHQRTHNGHLLPRRPNPHNLIRLHSPLPRPRIPPHPDFAVYATTPHLMRPLPRAPDVKPKLLLRKSVAPGTVPQREREVARVVDEKRVRVALGDVQIRAAGAPLEAGDAVADEMGVRLAAQLLAIQGPREREVRDLAAAGGVVERDGARAGAGGEEAVGRGRGGEGGDGAFEAAAAAFELVAPRGDGEDGVDWVVGVCEVEERDAVLAAGEEVRAAGRVGEAERGGEGFGEVVDQLVGC